MQGLELQKEYEKSQKDMVSWKALVQPGLATVLLIYFNEATLHCPLHCCPHVLAGVIVCFAHHRNMHACCHFPANVGGRWRRACRHLLACMQPATQLRTHAQAALFPVCLVVAMLFPNALEAFREAVAKEQSKTAIKAVEALNHDKTLAKLPAPPQATERLRLQVLRMTCLQEFIPLYPCMTLPQLLTAAQHAQAAGSQSNASAFERQSGVPCRKAPP